jgi:hypothetical protein
MHICQCSGTLMGVSGAASAASARHLRPLGAVWLGIEATRHGADETSSPLNQPCVRSESRHLRWLGGQFNLDCSRQIARRPLKSRTPSVCLRNRCPVPCNLVSLATANQQIAEQRHIRPGQIQALISARKCQWIIWCQLEKPCRPSAQIVDHGCGVLRGKTPPSVRLSAGLDMTARTDDELHLFA